MSKVAIVGAGAVGTAIAYAAQIRGVCRELALFDLNAGKVRAEVLDLNHGMQFTPMARITGSDDLEVCADADVVVITAGAKQKPGQTRLDLAAANVAMCRELVPALVAPRPGRPAARRDQPRGRGDVRRAAVLRPPRRPGLRLGHRAGLVPVAVPDRRAHRGGGAERARLHRRRARRLRGAAVVDGDHRRGTGAGLGVRGQPASTPTPGRGSTTASSARRTRSSRARARPASPSASPSPASSRRSCTTSTACCR